MEAIHVKFSFGIIPKHLGLIFSVAEWWLLYWQFGTTSIKRKVSYCMSCNLYSFCRFCSAPLSNLLFLDCYLRGVPIQFLYFISPKEFVWSSKFSFTNMWYMNFWPEADDHGATAFCHSLGSKSGCLLKLYCLVLSETRFVLFPPICSFHMFNPVA